MDMNSRDLLEQAIVTELENLGSLPEGESKSNAVNNLVALYKLKIDEEKIDVDADEKYNRRVMEDEHHQTDVEMRKDEIITERNLKQNAINEQRKDRWITAGTTLITTVLGLVAYNTWFRKGLKFEETGTITSPIIKNLLSKMIPSKGKN